MKLPSHVTHYFEKEVGPLLNICDLTPAQRREIIDREKGAMTGFNRFSIGEEFFDFRLLADDLLLECYAGRFGKAATRRPSYAVLGDADVVGGLYRDPYKIRIPIDDLDPSELTFICPDHFHLVSFMRNGRSGKLFGMQLPEDYSEPKHPYFGKLLSYEELVDGFETLGIDKHLERQGRENGWYRYVEAQVWADPDLLRSRYGTAEEVTPEPWTHRDVTYLQNYKELKVEGSVSP